ncbi:hypothetical protein [uncultured Bacteroides sp.]|uniref:hypothetical protein n=1 Tax=uncultured Bacteroides sp. TaxID=162156 RepID=UPI002AAAA8DD|nr:hypothetical protein [uncultured Bacteroides sp.]
MELEELKLAWNELNDKIQENEELSRRVITEMINQKKTTAFSRIKQFELRSLAICALLFVSVCLAVAIRNLPLWVELVAPICTFLITSWEIYKVWLISRINVDKNTLIEQSKAILHYESLFGRETIFLLVGVIIWGCSFILKHAYQDWFTIIVYTAVLIISLSLGIYLYKGVISKRIDDFLKATEELKDFEE